MFPLLSTQPFISPHDKEGKDLFRQVSSYADIKQIKAGETLYIINNSETVFPDLAKLAKEGGFTLHKIDRVPAHIRKLMSDKHRNQY